MTKLRAWRLYYAAFLGITEQGVIL